MLKQIALFATLLFCYPLFGQSQVTNNLFNKPTISQLQQQQSPQFKPFQPMSINPTPQNGYNNAPILNPASTQQQTIQAIIAQTQRADQKLAQEKQDLIEADKEMAKAEYLNTLAIFKNSYQELQKLNPNNFSITKAIYLVENTYNKNAFSYQQFEAAIKQNAEFAKQILKNEGILSKSNAALNYGIQKLYAQSNKVYDAKTKKTLTLLPFTYDDSDNYGKKDHRQTFVSKLIITGKGQCHSMPLLYLAIAEQLGAKAYLSLAPQHFFIQFANNKNQLFNFETTKGGIVSQNAMIQSGYITATALKNKIFLDTLSQPKLFAECLADFISGYINLFGYDDFASQIKERILQLDLNNLRVRIIEANMSVQIAQQKQYEAGNPNMKDLPKYPDAYNAYLQMQEKYKAIGNLGYQEMPKEAYIQWLKSIKKEKQQEMGMHKKTIGTFTNNIKR